MSRPRDPNSMAGKLRVFLPQAYEKWGPLSPRQYAYRAEVGGDILLSEKKSFQSVGKVLEELRDEGILPYSACLDSVREFHEADYTRDPDDSVAAFRFQLERLESERSFEYPVWHNQSTLPVVVCEKEGLGPFLEPVTSRYNVCLYPIRGHAGTSHLHEVFLPWLLDAEDRFDEVKIFYLGDLDKPGRDIERVVYQKLSKWGSVSVPGTRLAITPKTVADHGLRPGPEGKVELEALEPPVLKDIVREAIESCIDPAREDELLRLNQEATKYIHDEQRTALQDWIAARTNGSEDSGP